MRELENTIERALVLADGPRVTAENLPPHIRMPVPALDGTELAEDELSVKKHNAVLERRLIRKALERTGGNKTRAAQLLELSSRALLYKIRDYGLEWRSVLRVRGTLRSLRALRGSLVMRRARGIKASRGDVSRGDAETRRGCSRSRSAVALPSSWPHRS